MPLEHLEQVQAAAADFAAAAHRALATAPPASAAGASAAGGPVGAPPGEGAPWLLAPADWAPAHRRILAPAEEALGQYGDRELAYLSAELARVAAKGEGRRGRRCEVASRVVCRAWGRAAWARRMRSPCSGCWQAAGGSGNGRWRQGERAGGQGS